MCGGVAIQDVMCVCVWWCGYTRCYVCLCVVCGYTQDVMCLCVCVSGSFQDAWVIQAAYELNVPLHITTTDSVAVDTTSFITIDNPAVIIEALKKVRPPCLLNSQPMTAGL